MPLTTVSATTMSSLRILSALCVALPALVFIAVAVYRYEQIRTDSELRLDQTLRVADEHALKVLDTNMVLLDRVLDAVGTDSAGAIKLREENLHKQFRAMAYGKPQIQSIWFIGEDGRPLATDFAFPAPSADLSGREYFKWHRAQRGGVYVTEALFGIASKSWFFDMSRGRRHPDGSFAGVASISLRPAYFERFHADLAANEPGLAIALFRNDGAVISRWPPAPTGPYMLAASAPVMAQVAAGALQGDARGASTIDGRQRHFKFSRLGDYPLYIATSMDEGAATARWLRELAVLAAIGVPAMLGLFFAARIAVRRTGEALAVAERLHREGLARRAAEDALRQAQKLEALGRLTGGVAHDFNNALMVISTNVHLLKRAQTEAIATPLASIARAVASATKLTRQLLAFSRRQPLLPQYHDLHAALPDLGALLCPVLGAQIEFAADVAPGTSGIEVDPAELELALLNLAINARDAMPGNGRLRVSARNADGPLPASLHSAMVVIEVADTGMGIEPELLDKVFEPFFTTKPVGKGTGLGLSQVYGLCQRAGGTATVESRPGEGTTVRLYFPAVERPLHAPTTPVESTPPDLGQTILLVEDNDDVAGALLPVLESMGRAVTRLDRAEAAQAWLAERAGSAARLPDILLSDVVMPGEMDGAALALHVRSAYPAVRVILMTGYAERLEAISGLDFEILPKPCSPEMLAAAIGRAVGTR